MTIIHIVLFEWKSSATPEKIEEVCLVLKSWYHTITNAIQACNRMLALNDKCIHPTSQKPYIKSFSGGKNNSPEGQAVCR